MLTCAGPPRMEADGEVHEPAFGGSQELKCAALVLSQTGHSQAKGHRDARQEDRAQGEELLGEGYGPNCLRWHDKR